MQVRGRWQRLRRTGLVLGSTLGTLLVAEGITRAIGEVEPPVTRRHPTLGITYAPHLDADVYNHEAGRELHVRTNSLGFRGPEPEAVRAPEARRVLVLGDSFVAGLQVEERETAVAVAAAELAERTPPVELINLGVCGSSTAQELELYRQVGRNLEPDLVVCAYFVGNDYADNSRRMSKSPRVYFDLAQDGALVRHPGGAARRGLSAWLNEHSRLYVWQKRAIRRLKKESRANRVVTAAMATEGAEVTEAHAPSIPPRDLPARPEAVPSGQWIFDGSGKPELEETWRLNEALLATLRAEVEADGARFLLVLVPCLAQVHDGIWERSLRRGGGATAGFDREHPVRRLAAWAERTGTALLDVTPAVRAAAEGHRFAEAGLYFRGGHFTARGQGVFGVELAKGIAREFGGD